MDLTNKTINLLNFHTGIWRFANNILDVFSAVYLLGLGIPYPSVALALIASLVLRALLRPFALILSEKIGLRNTLIFGTVVSSGLFLVISRISGLNFWLYFYAVYSSLTDITYWLAYHSYYAAAGDEEKRGEQLGPELGLVTILKSIAPLAGGLIVAHFGFTYLYLSGMVVTLFSALPLLFARDVSPGTPLRFREAIRTIDKKGLIMQMGDGILYMHGFLWTIVLFYLVKNYTVFGGLITFELLITSVLCVVLGYYIDKGDGRQITLMGLVCIGAVIIFRSLWARTIPLVILSDVVFALALTFYSSSFDVSFYNLAKESHNTLWFHFFGEVGWDLGALIGFVSSAVLFTLGVPFSYIILVSLPGLFIVNYIVRDFYKKA